MKRNEKKMYKHLKVLLFFLKRNIGKQSNLLDDRRRWRRRKNERKPL